MDKNFVIKCQTDRYSGKWCLFHPDFENGEKPVIASVSVLKCVAKRETLRERLGL